MALRKDAIKVFNMMQRCDKGDNVIAFLAEVCLVDIANVSCDPTGHTITGSVIPRRRQSGCTDVPQIEVPHCTAAQHLHLCSTSTNADPQSAINPGGWKVSLHEPALADT